MGLDPSAALRFSRVLLWTTFNQSAAKDLARPCTQVYTELLSTTLVILEVYVAPHYDAQKLLEEYRNFRRHK